MDSLYPDPKAYNILHHTWAIKKLQNKDSNSLTSPTFGDDTNKFQLVIEGNETDSFPISLKALNASETDITVKFLVAVIDNQNFWVTRNVHATMNEGTLVKFGYMIRNNLYYNSKYPDFSIDVFKAQLFVCCTVVVIKNPVRAVDKVPDTYLKGEFNDTDANRTIERTHISLDVGLEQYPGFAVFLSSKSIYCANLFKNTIQWSTLKLILCKELKEEMFKTMFKAEKCPTEACRSIKHKNKVHLKALAEILQTQNDEKILEYLKKLDLSHSF